MSLPGLFIEYLVVGSLALLWAFPLAAPDLPFSDFSSLMIAALAPTIYVLGMFIDILAFALVTYFPRPYDSYKDRVRQMVEESERAGRKGKVQAAGKVLWGGFSDRDASKASLERHQEQMVKIWLLSRHSEIGKQIEMRSSRDRIARSSIINLALIFLVHLNSSPFYALASLTLAAFAVPMWVFYESSSQKFLKDAIRALRRPEFVEPPRKPQTDS